MRRLTNKLETIRRAELKIVKDFFTVPEGNVYNSLRLRECEWVMIYNPLTHSIRVRQIYNNTFVPFLRMDRREFVEYKFRDWNHYTDSRLFRDILEDISLYEKRFSISDFDIRKMRNEDNVYEIKTRLPRRRVI